VNYSEFYLDQLSYSDLDLGEPVYVSDGMFVLPNGDLVEEDSEDYKKYYRKYYERSTRSR
jgi:hypothetical protein